MKRTPIIIAVAALAVAVTACTPSVTVENTPASADGLAHGISVNGQGEVTGTPDTLTMTFGVSVLRDSVSEAVSVAADRADAIIKALKDQGVAEEDIQTANYSVWPEYDWSNNKQRLTGYRVNNSVNAKIRDLETAGETIDAVTSVGGDEVTVNGVSFSIEDNDALIEAAREAAWADAKGKAEQLASLAGVSLGDPVSINESFSTSPQPFRYEDYYAAAEDGGATTPISPGEQQVTVSVSVRFDIQR